jgi:hypothetical protein
MQKTGSTSIQSSLFHARLNAGFRYINFGQPNSSMFLATAFLPRPEDFYANKRRGLSGELLVERREALRKSLLKQLFECDEHTLIISAEDLTNMEPKALIDLRNFIGQFTQDIDLVGYIRAPKSFMESSLQERIKHGRSRFHIEQIFPMYRQRFEKFDKIFGRDHTFFWPFEPKEFPSGDVVLDFCSRIGLDFPAESVRRVNESLNLPAIKLLYAYRKYGPGYGVGDDAVRSNARLLRALQALPGPRLRLSPTLVEPLLEKFRDEIDWMENRLGHSLDESMESQGDQSIATESDLLSLDEHSLKWLANQLGPEYENRLDWRLSPRLVANWVHSLRLKLYSDSKSLASGQESIELISGDEIEMEIEKLITNIKESMPDKDFTVPDKTLIALLRKVFGHIRNEIENTPDGVVKVTGLGSFRIRQVEVEKGEKKEIVKRVVFQPPRAKAKETE